MIKFEWTKCNKNVLTIMVVHQRFVLTKIERHTQLKMTEYKILEFDPIAGYVTTWLVL